MFLTYTEVAFYIDGKIYSDKIFPCDIFEKTFSNYFNDISAILTGKCIGIFIERPQESMNMCKVKVKMPFEVSQKCF